MNIGTSLSSDEGPGTGGHIAWNIIQSYYAYYEYTCCLGVAVNPQLDTRGHKSVVREVNNHIIGKLKNRLLFYPFNLTSGTGIRAFPKHPSYCKNQYAIYPRESGKKIVDVEKELPKAFTLLENRGEKSLFNLLYDLRLWANYTGLQSLIKLNDGGYQQFLVKNLATIIFFAGAFAELTSIAALGEEDYIALLYQFSTEFIDEHERFRSKQVLLPLFVRLKIYQHLGFLAKELNLTKPIDPVSLVDL